MQKGLSLSNFLVLLFLTMLVGATVSFVFSGVESVLNWSFNMSSQNGG